jgi:hypothetical protein
MRYMLSMSATLADWPFLDASFPRELERQLIASGELVSEVALASPRDARLVRARGAPLLTRPFDRARSFLAGFWVVDCESPARAIEIAATLSAAPGRDGAPLNLPVEVRQVMSVPGEEM